MSFTPVLNADLIDQCFPMPSYRPNQREVIQDIVQSVNNGCKFVIAECPTGAGKSPIGVTLARLAQPAYYITTTKLLQDQFERDFPDVVTLKGRNAYPCTVFDTHPDRLRVMLGQHEFNNLKAQNLKCDEGYCKTKTGRGSCRLCLPSAEDRETRGVVFPEGHNFSFCPYFEKFYQAVNAPVTSMNFNNFILHLNYGGKFRPRRMLIIDEAHNCEEKLLGFLECTIASNHIDTQIPKLNAATDYAKWLTDIDAIGVLKEKYEHAQERLKIKDMNLYESLMKRYITMILQVRDDPNGWVFEYEKDERTEITKAIIKPIFAHRAANEFLFSHADCVVFLSATILNARTFAENLGIPEGQYRATRVPSTFPIKNRPIVIDYAGKFVGGKSKMDNWIKIMAKKVEEICQRYATQRGIIHTHSFGIQKALMENLPSRVTNRLIQQFDYDTKTEMLAAHAKKPNSIIIAPAMHEGVDLKDDLSRFQILCKVPYANFYENKQLEARMEIDRKYYDFITILKIVQSVGRSVRSATDWADTFIIDEAFERIYRSNQASFPQWFKEAVTKNIPQPRIACDSESCECTPLTGCQKL